MLAHNFSLAENLQKFSSLAVTARGALTGCKLGFNAVLLNNSSLFLEDDEKTSSTEKFKFSVPV